MDRFMNMTSGMTSGVASTVSSWWGSNSEKKGNADNGNNKQDENTSSQNPQSAHLTNPEPALAAGELTSNTEKSISKQISGGDEDSPPTSEADSVSNQSEIGGETPLDEKQAQIEGDDKSKSFVGGVQVGINEVSTKAIESAKSLGNFLFSVANKAGKTVSDTAKHIKHTVEENSILGEFNREQDTFLKDKNSTRNEAAVPPWVGYAEEDIMKQQILSLSLDRRNFLRSPPSGVQFQFDFATMHPIALATLAEDPNLEKIRFELVPKLISEENFWKNYFYRVSLIKQSTQLSSLAQETSSTGGDSSNSNHSSRKSSVDDSKSEF
ncbi:Synapse-associated protein 1 [Chamberlinius hualienensis]